ncbi:hypothetical protein AUP68_13703 [Ilyonectria robusta]
MDIGTLLTCLALALASRAGFPPGVFNVLTTSLANTQSPSEAMRLSSLIQKVTFTGSTGVGKIMAGLCVKDLKKCVLSSWAAIAHLSVSMRADLDQASE